MSAKVADNVILDEKEKVSIEQRSPAESLDAHDDDSELLAPEVRQVAERHLVRVLDSRLMPTIIIIFLMNYIDVSVLPSRLYMSLTHCIQRNGITTARLKGLEQDLGLSGTITLLSPASSTDLCANYDRSSVPSHSIHTLRHLLSCPNPFEYGWYS